MSRIPAHLSVLTTFVSELFEVPTVGHVAQREAGLINMMLPLLSRSTGRLARHPVHLLSRACTRTTRNFTTQPGIPVGASPQLLLSAVASHRSGASMDLARVIFEHGGSIAGTKKVMLENHFAMLIAVYTPPTGTSPADLAQKLASPETASRLGFEVQASLLDESRPAAAARSEKGERRRLQLRCPQRPGIVLAITELLKDGNCKMSSIDADTMEKGSEIWFEVRACPRQLRRTS